MAPPIAHKKGHRFDAVALLSGCITGMFRVRSCVPRCAGPQDDEAEPGPQDDGGLAVDAGWAATGQFAHLGQIGSGGIARGGHGDGSVSGPKVYGVLQSVELHQAVN